MRTTITIIVTILFSCSPVFSQEDTARFVIVQSGKTNGYEEYSIKQLNAKDGGFEVKSTVTRPTQSGKEFKTVYVTTYTKEWRLRRFKLTKPSEPEFVSETWVESGK